MCVTACTAESYANTTCVWKHDSVTAAPESCSELSCEVDRTHWQPYESAACRIKSTFSACLTSSGFCSASSSTSSYCPLLRTHAAVLSTGDIVAESTGDWTWSRDTCKHFSEKLHTKCSLFGGEKWPRICRSQRTPKNSLAEILQPPLTLDPQHLLESL